MTPLRCFLVLLCQFAALVASGQLAYDALELTPGPYETGYARLTLTDPSRTYFMRNEFRAEPVDRPVPVSIWYPAKKESTGRRLAVADYLAVYTEEMEWGEVPGDMLLDWYFYPENPVKLSNVRQLTTAREQPAGTSGNHPLVVYAPSYGAGSAENFMLCEYLASHGYLVAAAPSRGADDLQLEGGTIRDAEAQSRDLELLIDQAERFGYVDKSSIYLVGFSFGGLSDVITALRNRRVAGVVSLDGTVKYHPEVLAKSAWYTPGRLTAPFVHFSQDEIPSEVREEQNIPASLDTAFTFLDDLGGPRYEFRMEDLSHGHFASFGLLFQERDPRQDTSYAAIGDAYERLCRMTLLTLDRMRAYARDTAGWNHEAYLAELGLDKSVTHLSSKVPERSVDPFPKLVGWGRENDFAGLERQLSTLRRQHPDFTPAEWKLNTLGLQLIFTPATFTQGRRIFEFALSLYPESANLYDSLAEGYRVNGDEAAARRNFERSLELNADNENAKKRLRQLGGR